MRGSTAAGINISLLPRDCSCGEFACSAVWEEASFLVFVGFPVALSGEETFFSGICVEFADGVILEESSFS